MRAVNGLLCAIRGKGVGRVGGDVHGNRDVGSMGLVLGRVDVHRTIGATLQNKNRFWFHEGVGIRRERH